MEFNISSLDDSAITNNDILLGLCDINTLYGYHIEKSYKFIQRDDIEIIENMERIIKKYNVRVSKTIIDQILLAKIRINILDPNSVNNNDIDLICNAFGTLSSLYANMLKSNIISDMNFDKKIKSIKILSHFKCYDILNNIIDIYTRKINNITQQSKLSSCGCLCACLTCPIICISFPMLRCFMNKPYCSCLREFENNNHENDLAQYNTIISIIRSIITTTN